MHWLTADELFISKLLLVYQVLIQVYVVILTWWVLGHSLAFGEGGPAANSFIGGNVSICSREGLQGWVGNETVCAWQNMNDWQHDAFVDALQMQHAGNSVQQCR